MARAIAEVALLNHIGSGNLGDDATLQAVMSNIKRRWPDAKITALTMNPEDTRKRHRVCSYPIRSKTWSFGYVAPTTQPTLKGKFKDRLSRNRFLFRFLRIVNAALVRGPKGLLREISFLVTSFRIMKSFDLLVICGGGQLTEWGGPWRFPYTIFKWVLLAKRAGARVIFLNVGAGPLLHPLSKMLVVRALRPAQYVSFRDLESQALARKIGFRGKSQVFPDSVYGLESYAPGPYQPETRDEPTVGIAPLPYCNPRTDPAEKDQYRYDEFIAKMAAFASRLSRDSYSLALFGSDIGVDPLAIEDLQAVLQDRHGVVARRCDSTGSIQDLLSAISRMDYVVTCRFHGVIFAHLLLKPVLAISPHPKVRNLMKRLGLEQYCLDIGACDVASLTETFEALVRHTDEIKGQLAATLASNKSSLRMQFDELFPGKLVGREPSALVSDGPQKNFSQLKRMPG